MASKPPPARMWVSFWSTGMLDIHTTDARRAKKFLRMCAHEYRLVTPPKKRAGGRKK